MGSRQLADVDSREQSEGSSRTTLDDTVQLSAKADWRVQQGTWSEMEAKHGPLGFHADVGEAMQMPVQLVWKRADLKWRRWVIVAESAVMRRAGWRGLGLYAWTRMDPGVVIGRYDGAACGREVKATDKDALEQLAAVYADRDCLLWRQVGVREGAVWLQMVDGAPAGPPFLQRANDGRGQVSNNCVVRPSGDMCIDLDGEGIDGLAMGRVGWGGAGASEILWSYQADYWLHHNERMCVAGERTLNAERLDSEETATAQLGWLTVTSLRELDVVGGANTVTQENTRTARASRRAQVI